MQTIERYGVIVLVLCAVSIGAVWMWESDAPEEGADSARVAAAEPAQGPQAVPDRGSSARPTDVRTRPNRVGGRRRSQLTKNNLDDLKNVTKRGGGLVGGAQKRLASTVGAGERESTKPKTIIPAAVSTHGPKTAPKASSKPAVSGSSRVYVVLAGDTLSEISLRELGTSKRWREFLQVNPGLNANKLVEGMRLKLPAAGPSKSAPKTAKTLSAPGQGQVRIAKGDSLWKIAERALGDGSRYREIAALNPKVNPDRLDVGVLLTLPTGPRPKTQPKLSSPKVARASTPQRSASNSSKKGRVR